MLIKKSLTAVALLASLLGASAAFAHAHLKSATPAADSTVAAPAAHRLGHAGAEQTGRTGLQMQISRQVTAALPVVGVGQDFAFGEGAHRFSEFLAFWGMPDVGHSNLSGMSRCRDRNHSPRPLACGSNRA